MLKYFNYEEFDSPDEDGSGLPTTDGGKMSISFLHKLDEARAIAGVPFKITSGYRSEKHNATGGGRVGSSHAKTPCKAVDIHCNNSLDRTIIINALVKVGLGRRMGIGKTFIHTDDDKDKPAAIWLY
jgi:zinc D-Ala-D-Ala carboxypeptidase